MGNGGNSTNVRKALLAGATALTLSGIGSLGIVGDGAPTASPSTTRRVDASAPTTSTTSGRIVTKVARRGPRTSTSWEINYEPVDAPHSADDATAVDAPIAAQPDAQFDVAVPALGAQASAGQGDGSCTTVRLTAITPEGCGTQPPGEGPVVVRYSGTGVGRSLGKGPTQQESFAPRFV